MAYNLEEAAVLIEQWRPAVKWDEIARRLNERFGLDLGESAYRKAYVRSGMEAKRDLKLEKQYLRYEKAANFDDIRDLTLKTMFTDELKEAILSKSVERKWVSVPVENLARDKEYVFVLSDLHYDGEASQLDAVEKAYQHICSKQKELGFTKIRLLELGDTIDGGSLRVSQLMAIKKGMVFQIIDVAKVYVQLVEKLTETMVVDFHIITSSNHTQIRPLGTKQNQLVEEDLMHIFAEYVELALKGNARARVYAGDDMVVDLVGGFKMFIAHGHLIGNKKEGYLQELAFHRGLQIDYGLFGHYHHYREVTLYDGGRHNKKVFYAPSMSTAESDYEHDKNLSSHSGILMMVFNEKTGHSYSEELFV